MISKYLSLQHGRGKSKIPIVLETVCSILKKYAATLQLDKDPTVTEWMHLKQENVQELSVYDLVQIVNTSNPDTPTPAR